MAIQGITGYSVMPSVNFKSKHHDYENPINRQTERNLAVLSSAGLSTLVGGLAGTITYACRSNKGVKVPLLVGAGVALASLALTLPPKLYNAKVNAFAREKETDVFSRQKEAQSNIYEGINDEIEDENISLDDKINHYSTVKMADNGNGLIVKGV